MAMVQTPETDDALLALLDWYVESGVDIALDDAPHDRYADSARAPAVGPAPSEVMREETAPPRAAPARSAPRAERPPPAAATRREVALVAPDEAARAAAQAAAEARDLDDLAARLAAFDHAPFREMARHFLFGASAGVEAPLMAFDIAPGETEETTGEPFCGRQARLLDNMLAAIGFDCSRARLAYLSPWRPPGSTNLTPQQIAIFAPFARRHVELARPRVLLLFGEAPMRALVDATQPMSKLRGRAQEARCGDHVATAFALPTLDSMLNSRALKPSAWRDLRAAAKYLT